MGPLQDLSSAAIRKLVAAGLVSPARGRRGQQPFSFEELVILRTAAAMLRAKVPMRRLLGALAALRARQPAATSLSALSLSAVGADVVVRDGSARWKAESGQLLLDFEAWAPGEIHHLQDAGEAGDAGADERGADEWFSIGEQLEPSDPAAAEAAYRSAVACDPCCVMAWLNLGALLGEQERWDEAAALYARALTHCPNDPSLHFSVGVAHERLEVPGKALRSYERCLQAQPDYADAHLHVARLLETLGDQQGAIRHLSAYRRASRSR